MTIEYYHDIVQGTEEWLELRRGILTASEMKLIITPTLKIASNEKERAHLYELAAQRISGFVEPSYISDDMLRGMDDEADAVELYSKHYAPVTSCGFITNDEWGFKIGYSPDGLVGDDGLIEAKSRRQKFQIETIVKDAPPPDYIIQLQTGLLVTKRAWVDYVSYSAGLPCAVIMVHPDPVIQNAIIEAAGEFYERLENMVSHYYGTVEKGKYIQTERKKQEELTEGTYE